MTFMAVLLARHRDRTLGSVDPVLASNLGANGKVPRRGVEVEATAAGRATPMTAAFMAPEELLRQRPLDLPTGHDVRWT